MINISNLNYNNIIINQQKTKQEELNTKDFQKKDENVKTISSDYAIAALGIHRTSIVSSKNTDTIKSKTTIDNLPFADKYSPADKRAIDKVLKENDDETLYLRKMINLISDEKVNPYALSHLCKNSQISQLVKKDMDIYFDKVVNQNISIEDAFVPEFSSQSEGLENTEIGGVFRIEGKKNIYTKTDDDSVKPLKMDANTYLKLFPPIERFASCQGSTSDCYLLSTINSIMENPNARIALYSSFSQDEDGINAKLRGSKISVHYSNCELPDNVDKDKYASGALGVQILEHLYSVDFEQRQIERYSKVMSKEIDKMSKKLSDFESISQSDVSTVEKQKKLEAKIQKYKITQHNVLEELKKPNHKLTFILDDEDNFIMGDSGPLFNNCDQMDSSYKYPSDYYRGAIGGYAENVLPRFGFKPEVYDMDFDEDEIEDILLCSNSNDFIITAGTYDDESSEIETPVCENNSIYSSHSYKITPFDDENGDRKFKVTNPWNQSQQVVMSYKMLQKYFSRIVASYIR